MTPTPRQAVRELAERLLMRDDAPEIPAGAYRAAETDLADELEAAIEDRWGEWKLARQEGRALGPLNGLSAAGGRDKAAGDGTPGVLDGAAPGPVAAAVPLRQAQDERLVEGLSEGGRTGSVVEPGSGGPPSRADLNAEPERAT